MVGKLAEYRGFENGVERHAPLDPKETGRFEISSSNTPMGQAEFPPSEFVGVDCTDYSVLRTTPFFEIDSIHSPIRQDSLPNSLEEYEYR